MVRHEQGNAKVETQSHLSRQDTRPGFGLAAKRNKASSTY